MGSLARNNWFTMEPFLNDMFPDFEAGKDHNFFSPSVDITEKKSGFEIVADLPGVKKEDIKVHLNDGMLTLQAKTETQSKSEEDKVIRKERRSGFISRSFNVGKSLTADDVKADFTDGVLTIDFPKTPEISDQRQSITIN